MMGVRPYQLRRACKAIDSGGIIAYPTEAVWGLGCDPLNAEAVLRLLALKERPWRKGLILIASELDQLRLFVELNPELERQVMASWPGPVTWLLPASPFAPPWITGDSGKIAVRITAHPLAAALCEACGTALVSTSANVGGQPAALSANKVRKLFGEQVDVIIHGALGGRERPSEIRDAQSGQIVRAG